MNSINTGNKGCCCPQTTLAKRAAAAPKPNLQSNSKWAQNEASYQ